MLTKQFFNVCSKDPVKCLFKMQVPGSSLIPLPKRFGFNTCVVAPAICILNKLLGGFLGILKFETLPQGPTMPHFTLPLIQVVTFSESMRIWCFT